jgi:hypothetical protein
MDELRLSRTSRSKAKLVSLLCAAVYTEGDSTAASKLIGASNCLAVCGGSSKILSEMLQTSHHHPGQTTGSLE